jgi:ribosomal protein S18 acetylase RimI-like enzyme
VVILRQAGAADVRAIALLTRDAYAMYVPRIGREPAPMTADHGALVEAGEVWVAEAGDGTVAGAVVVRRAGDALLLESVAVAPSHQGRGIGRRLIEHAEALAREGGLESVELYTNVHMTENLSLYPALGYEETGRATEDGFERVYFRKRVRR